MSRRRNKPSRIAFGSCNEQDRQNNLWPIIESRRPAAFVWGGDAIYAGACKMDDKIKELFFSNLTFISILEIDHEHHTDFSTFPPTAPFVECATPARVRKLYQEALAVPGYESLRNSNVTIFGTIDGQLISGATDYWFIVVPSWICLVFLTKLVLCYFRSRLWM